MLPLERNIVTVMAAIHFPIFMRTPIGADTPPDLFAMTVKALLWAAWAADSGAVAAGAPAASVVAGRAFASIRASLAGVAALAAVFSIRPPSAASVVDAPAPVSAGVSGVPAPVWRLAFPALAGISCPRSGSPR